MAVITTINSGQTGTPMRYPHTHLLTRSTTHNPGWADRYHPPTHPPTAVAPSAQQHTNLPTMYSNGCCSSAAVVVVSCTQPCVYDSTAVRHSTAEKPKLIHQQPTNPPCATVGTAVRCNSSTAVAPSAHHVCTCLLYTSPSPRD